MARDDYMKTCREFMATSWRSVCETYDARALSRGCEPTVTSELMSLITAF